MGGIEQYTPSSRGGVLTNIPPLDNSKILLMGVLTNIPPPPEGGYWPIYPLERILLLSRWVYPGKYPAIQNTTIYFSPYYNDKYLYLYVSLFIHTVVDFKYHNKKLQILNNIEVSSGFSKLLDFKWRRRSSRGKKYIIHPSKCRGQMMVSLV